MPMNIGHKGLMVDLVVLNEDESIYYQPLLEYKRCNI